MRVLAVWLAFGFAALGQASAGGGSVSFAFERPGLPVPSFLLRVEEDGTGVYRGLGTLRAARPGVSDGPQQPFEQPVTVSGASVAKVFAAARELKLFNTNCNSKGKNLANTGRKTLTYTGPDGTGACTYNYSDLKSVTELTALFLGMAETMDEGRELDRLHRYDRLGLDAAIQQLGEQVAAGRALEIQNIAQTLRSIAGDPDVILRARTRANALLATLPAEAAQGGPPGR